MEVFLGTIATFLMLSFLLVFMSGEFHPRNQNVKTWLGVAVALPVGGLLLIALVGSIL